MFSPDDFQYAIENTRVVVQPEQRIETFGTTSFHFVMVSELLDQVNQVRIRDGHINAERPRIISPQHYSRLLLDGFGEDAREFAGWIENNNQFVKILRYGFQLKKTDFSEHILHEPMESVVAKIEQEFKEKSDPMSVLIEGVDDAWEVCLLKFTVDLINRSAGENVAEWKRRGLI